MKRIQKGRGMALWGSLLFAVVLQTATAAGAGGPYLVKDLQTTPETSFYDYYYSYKRKVCVTDDAIYFTQPIPGQGQTLWKSDGTPEGTVILNDLAPDGRVWYYDTLNASGNAVYWSQYSLSFQTTKLPEYYSPYTLVKSNGTTAGTRPIFKSPKYQCPITQIAGESANDIFVFSGYDITHGTELRAVNDGSYIPYLVKDINTGSEWNDEYNVPNHSVPLQFCKLGNDIIFIAYTNKDKWCFMKSNGDSGSCEMIKPGVYSGFWEGDSYKRQMTSGKYAYYYIGNDIWATDGTKESTLLIHKLLAEPPYYLNSCAFVEKTNNDNVYFAIQQGANVMHPNELLVTNIKSKLATKITENTTYKYKSSENGDLFFTMQESDNYWMCKYSLNLEEMVKLKTVSNSNISMTAIGNDLYFFDSASKETHGLWHINPDTNEVVLLSEFTNRQSMPYFLVNKDDSAYFVINKTPTSLDLWELKNGTKTNALAASYSNINVSEVSDPVFLRNELYFFTREKLFRHGIQENADASISLVESLYDNYGSYPIRFANYHNNTIYYCKNGLWITNGASDTRKIPSGIISLDADQMVGDSSGVQHCKPAIINDVMYYYALSKNLQGDYINGIWRTDGTSEGSYKLMDSNGGSLCVFKNQLYQYVSNSLKKEVTVQKIDIDAKVAIEVKKISCSAASQLFVYKNGLAVIDCIGSFIKLHENLTSDPTYISSTPLLGSLNINYPSNTDYTIVATNQGIYFPYIPTTYPPPSNGVNFYDFAKGKTNLIAATPTPAFIYYKGRAYFANRELYVEKSSHDGAELVKDINPGVLDGEPTGFTAAGDVFFMSATTASHGRELWKSDGTTGGTVMVKDINPGIGSSNPSVLTEVNGTLYFSASDGVNGVELWKSDGTEAGTVRVGDIWPGVCGSNPAELVNQGDRLVFSAMDGIARGQELWALDLPAPAAPENAAGAAVDTTTLRWSWEDYSDKESGFRVWCDPGTAAPVTLRATLAADTAAWVQNGLAANTPYTFQVAAFDGEGESRRTAPVTVWTHIEPVAALEYPEITPRSITLRAAAPVPSNLDQGGSGLRFANLSQGVYSDWTRDNTKGWTSTGLNPDTPHAFWARSRNGAGAVSTPAMDVKWTAAETPGAPLLSAVTPHGMTASLPADGNPAHTWYALRVTPPVAGRSWVQADGSLGASPLFMQRAGWTNMMVTGLPDGTAHTLRFIAQNGEGLNTPFGPGTTATTPDVTPPVAEITLPDPNPINADRLRFVVRFSEPVGGSFDASDITLSGNLAGSVASSGMDPDYLVEVALEPGAEQGFLGITITGSVADLEGNPLGGAASPQYEVLRWAGFTAHPQGARLYAGQSHTLSAAVAPDQLPVAWQWRRMAPDGAAGNGPAAAQWVLNNAAPEDSAVYWCEAGKNGNTHPSRTATVTVAQHLRITVQPRDALALTGTAHTLSVETEGGHAPLRYQWRKNEGNIPGANGRELVLSPLELGDGGLYAVEVADDLTDSVLSDAALLTVEKAMPAPSGAAALALAALLVALAGAKRARGKLGRRG